MKWKNRLWREGSVSAPQLPEDRSVAIPGNGLDAYGEPGACAATGEREVLR